MQSISKPKIFFVTFLFITKIVFSLSIQTINGTANYPENNAIGIALNILLEWETVDSAIAYDVYFGETNPPKYFTRTTNNFLNPGVLSSNNKYYWKVNIVTTDGVNSGEVLNFTTASETIKILPLGNSITVQSTGQASYRYFLWKLLKRDKLNIDFVGTLTGVGGDISTTYFFDQDHEGHGGWEANQVDDKINEWLTYYTPDIALIHLGTNDLFHAQTVESTVEDINSIIEKLRNDNPNVTVLLAKIIPVSWYAPQWGELNEALEEFSTEITTEKSRVIIVDQNKNYDPAKYSVYDGVHPNLIGDSVMAEVWYDSLKSVIFYDGVNYLNPSNKSDKLDNTISFLWNEDTLANQYEFTLGKSDSIIYESICYDSTFKISDLDYETKYFWKVDKIVDTDTIYGRAQTFTTNYEKLPPEKASNYFPKNNKIDIELNSELSWEIGRRTQTSLVYFGKSNPPEYIGKQTEVNYTPDNLDYNTTYYWKIDLENEFGFTEGEVLSFQTLDAQKYPTDWFSQHIGNKNYDDNISVMDNNYTITTIGNDLATSADQFFFLYTELKEDFEISVKLKSIESAAQYAHAGIMIREDLSEGARFTSLALSNQNKIYTQKRSYPDYNSERNLKDSVEFPYWLKLSRMSGEYFIKQVSYDGVNWEIISSEQMKFEDQAVYGLFVTSGDSSNICSVKFDSLSINNVLLNVENDYSESHIPIDFSISSYPNPFNLLTTINYQVPSIGKVKIVVYDILGRKIKTLVNSEMNSGKYKANWNGRNQLNSIVNSGIYFVHGIFEDQSLTRKIMLLK